MNVLNHPWFFHIIQLPEVCAKNPTCTPYVAENSNFLGVFVYNSCQIPLNSQVFNAVVEMSPQHPP